MSLSPEQNAAWCRKCIDLINGDDMSDENEIEVFPTTAQLRAYLTEGGDVCLQQDGLFGQDDAFVYVPLPRIEDLIKALRALAAKAGAEE